MSFDYSGVGKSIVPVLESRLPAFVRDQYPRFVRFLTDFYTWLEEPENFLHILEQWKTNLEPTIENDPYVDALLRDLGWDIGQDIHPKKSLLLHGLRDFYLSRGTETSFKFLWRVLYDADVEIRYPREELLIPSSAQYGERYYLFTTLTHQETEEFAGILASVAEYGGNVLGLSSKSQADVESVQIQLGFRESFLMIETLRPIFPFEPGETIRLTSSGYQIEEVVRPVLGLDIIDSGNGYKVGDTIAIPGASVTGQCVIDAIGRGPITELTIVDGGTGYSVGDRIKAHSASEGFGFSAMVSGVDLFTGAITDVTLDSGGYNFDSIPSISVSSVSGTGANLVAFGDNIGSIKRIKFNEPCLGYPSGPHPIYVIQSSGTGAVLAPRDDPQHQSRAWETTLGFVNNSSRTIDSHKYQQFSYNIVSEVQTNRFDGIVKDLLHPVGYARFGTFELSTEETLVISGAQGDVQVPTDEIIIEIDFDLVLGHEFALERNDALGLDDGSGEVLGVIVQGQKQPLKVT